MLECKVLVRDRGDLRSVLRRVFTLCPGSSRRASPLFRRGGLRVGGQVLPFWSCVGDMVGSSISLRR